MPTLSIEAPTFPKHVALPPTLAVTEASSGFQRLVVLPATSYLEATMADNYWKTYDRS